MKYFNIDEVAARLRRELPDAVAAVQLEAIDPWIELKPESLAPACRFLRDEPGLQFDFLNCLTAVDYLETDPKRAAKGAFEPHMELVYHLSSVALKQRLTLKVRLPRWKDDSPGQLPEIASVAGLWRTADWHEREVYDLSGVRFLGHPELRRILCPEDWEGHPLRKDYEMPLEYHGIRAR
jgi:NADH-quinone oxidoreductase subunit C